MPWLMVNQTRLSFPTEVPTPLLALEVQRAGMPGQPGALMPLSSSMPAPGARSASQHPCRGEAQAGADHDRQDRRGVEPPPHLGRRGTVAPVGRERVRDQLGQVRRAAAAALLDLLAAAEA